VVLPMVLPSVVAGSIFTFSLSLGDYITVQIVGGKTQLIGNLVYSNIGTTTCPWPPRSAPSPSSSSWCTCSRCAAPRRRLEEP
jgi:ABC-type spermidine/putrescine transport system permease subunit I